MSKKVESIVVGLPVHFKKFRSDRIDNFRVYMFAGGKAEYDLCFKCKSKKSGRFCKAQKIDFGVEAGIGYFYFPVLFYLLSLK